MRYHSAVLAAKNARPFVALSYENKMLEVCNYTYMSEYVVDLQSEHYDAERFYTLMIDALENSRKISERLSALVAQKLKPSAMIVLEDQIRHAH